MILLQEKFQCNYGGVDVQAKLDIQAQLQAQIDTSFGLTIITTLEFPPGPQQIVHVLPQPRRDHVHLHHRCHRSGTYATQDIELFGLQNFNALFSVPGIVTVVRVAYSALLTPVVTGPRIGFTLIHELRYLYTGSQLQALRLCQHGRQPFGKTPTSAPSSRWKAYIGC